MICISYNLNNYIQYKHNEKLSEGVCFHLHSVVTFHHLNGNENLLKQFANLVQILSEMCAGGFTGV